VVNQRYRAREVYFSVRALYTRTNAEHKGERRAMKHRLLNVAEVATLLNMSEIAVRMRVFTNTIPYHRWGKKIVFSEAELDRFIEQLPGLSVKQAAAKVEGDAA